MSLLLEQGAAKNDLLVEAGPRLRRLGVLVVAAPASGDAGCCNSAEERDGGVGPRGDLPGDAGCGTVGVRNGVKLLLEVLAFDSFSMVGQAKASCL